MENKSTDWLGSQTIFYNTITSKYSSKIAEVINFEHFEWDVDGLQNYLDFGYCAFGATPIKNVKFLRPNSKLNLVNNKLVEILDDSAERKIFSFLDRRTEPALVIEKIIEKVRSWELSLGEDKVVLPLSGGYDSRLLASAIKNRQRLVCFTYGISSNQSQSFEVVKAQHLANRLGLEWHPICLGDFHNYLDEWNKSFGVSTHAHGMYHIEFYTNILKQNGAVPQRFLSGLIGDIWAGSVVFPEVKAPRQLKNLGYSHGMNADSTYLIGRNKTNKVLEGFFEAHELKLNDPRYRVIEAMRVKIMLLKYLLEIPKTFNFRPFAPYIDQDIALSMLCLPCDERKDRKWQKDYFTKINLNIESEKLSFSPQNSLNTQALKKIPLLPLKTDILREIIKPGYVDWINRNLLNTRVSKYRYKLGILRKKNKFIRKFLPKDRHLKAYFAYLTLEPLQRLIVERDRFLRDNRK